MQVGRVKQHHVTYLLLQKRINSGDFTAVGAFVSGKKRRKEEKKKEERREESEEASSTVVSRTRKFSSTVTEFAIPPPAPGVFQWKNC